VIAGVPLGPDGLTALAALLALRGSPGGEPDAPLAVALAEAAPAEPAAALAAVLARRRSAAEGEAIASGTSPAARFLRRLERRARTAQRSILPPAPEVLAEIGRGARAHVPPGPEPPDPESVGLWILVWAEPDPGRRRDLVAAAPPARARWVGHAPPLTPEAARRLLAP
jgi:hypothetical protein